MITTVMRHDWQLEEIEKLFSRPFLDLVYEAQGIHRQYFSANSIQQSTLLSIKSGACSEDCAYCPQSGHYKTPYEKENLLSLEVVKEKALAAKAKGSTRFCMGGAWRSPPDKVFNQLLEMVKVVKSLGMEACMTLGMLSESQAQALKEAGLDYYNHNLDTSPEYYEKIITTRTYDDRLSTLDEVRKAGMKVCCGGIMGMGESRRDRARFLQILANLETHPESVPINRLIPVPGTPLQQAKPLDPFEFVKTIAVARIVMPTSKVRLSAGREGMTDELQALCFMAGANSIFYGEKLLMTKNPDEEKDRLLLERLGMQVEA